jgi:DNA-binding MarR family transcriptional regulator
MPRLDAARIDVWRRLAAMADDVRRAMDDPIREVHGIALDWFEVLTVLRAFGGSAQPSDLADQLGVVPSTLSRRLERMVDDGLIEREYRIDGDRRVVDVSLTSEGSAVWRDINITYRRELQARVGRHLTDSDVAALQRLLTKIEAAGGP